MTIKLLQIGGSHNLGLTGQNTFLALAYKKLIDIDLLLVSDEGQQYVGLKDIVDQANIKHIVLKGLDKHRKLFYLVNSYKNLLKYTNPNIIVLNTNWQLFIVTLAKLLNLRSVPVVYILNAYRHNEPFKSNIARFFIGLGLILFSCKVIAPSKFVANKFSFLGDKLHVIPLGLDPAFFSQRCRSDFNERNDIVFPANFRHGKNQIKLIKIFYKYINASENHLSKLYLPGDGPLLQKVIDCTHQLGLSENVIFPGQLNRREIIDLYLQCKIAVIPSNVETFGYCICEPLSLGCITISRKTGLAGQYLVEGENAFLFEDDDELLNKLLQVSNYPISKLEAISTAAIEISKNFQWDDIAKAHLENVYRPIMAKNQVGEF